MSPKHTLSSRLLSLRGRSGTRSSGTQLTVSVFCVIMDIHPREECSWFNGAQTGGTVQCSGPFPFDSLSTGGGVTPMRRLLSPGGSERCSFLEQEQRSEETPALSRWFGLKKQAHAARPPTLTYTLCTLGGPQPSFKGIFDTGHY